MPLPAKTVRNRLMLLRPVRENMSLSSVRSTHEKLGELMEFRFRGQVLCQEQPFDRFTGAWVIPKDVRRQGVILYLHGGGYCCGGLHYATGFGSQLACATGTHVFCAAYRLAPEHPYPAALEDAVESYRYLLSMGHNKIVLCGESAGGGLCYSLCMRLRELGLPLPSGIIAISPWTDLTASGISYKQNMESDPNMRLETLDFYATQYASDRRDPLVSPLFGDLTGMPPSLIYAGSDEIMLSDAGLLHEKLRVSQVTSQLVVGAERWHAYLLYGLREDAADAAEIGRFLNRNLARENKLRWLELDNAAKLYPAARRRTWSNIFRLSVTLKEPVDRQVLQSALDVTVRRFPSIAARLRKGLFWYYLQQLDRAPQIREESSYPLTRMSKKEMRKCALRVIVYENRIALELFHSLTDGNGALIFLKSLTAEYLQQKHGIRIPAQSGVVDRLEEVSEAELEDSFQKYGGTVQASRKANNAWRLTGTPEKDGFLNLTCFRLPAQAVLDKAHEYGVSATTFLCACMMMALQQLQQEQVPNPLLRKSIKVLLPVNLRKLFPSTTLRNFVMYTTPEIMPRLGFYDFKEICQLVQHKMGLDITPKHMSTMIATNIKSEQLLAVRVVPLFMKNLVMKAIFDSVGERKSCLTMSNLGQVTVPDAMKQYISHFDMILGIQATAPYNCGIISYGGELRMNLIRNITEPLLENQLYRVLRDMGIPVCLQSNLAERS